MYYWNVGFLHAYKGNLRKAAQLYRTGTVLGLPPDAPAQLEEFMTNIVTLEPEKTQLHYCLGILNRDVKGDTARAIEEFTHFLERTPAHQFARDRLVVRKWLEELKSQLDSSQ